MDWSPSKLGLALLTLGSLFVAAQAQEPRPQFVRDVLPVLTKNGCNAGACHGAFQGRGGFRLSLLGFDPEFDFAALVKENRGRRVLPTAPEQSLVLRKPSGQMAHGGGRKLPVDSEAYRRLRAWIAAGTPGPDSSDARILRLEVSHTEVQLQAKQKLPITIHAVWSDGRKDDVAAWCLYDSSQEQVASVPATGTIQANGRGRTAVMIRFLDQFAIVNVSVPFGPALAAAPPAVNTIDQHLQTTWQKLGLKPAPASGDAEFVRRLYLDLIGTLPTPAEVRTFLASSEAAKRGKLIDELLDRPEYVDAWSLKWADLLRAHKRALGEKGLKSFSTWLRNAVRDNKPVDQLVRELILAQGNLYAQGPVAFYFVDQTPEDLAETTAQVFLGIRLQCAKCHHHPFEVWSQEDYYSLAAYFARIERKDTKEEGRFGGAQSIRVAAVGDLKHPRTGLPVPPRPLGAAPRAGDSGDPRQPLAEWLTDPKNAYFARNIVNRTWGHLLGRGLVDPVDDLRTTNPATHPELLTALADDFVKHNFDMKRLIRLICNSQAYQLASELEPTRDQDGQFFTHRRPRRLSAEVLLDAVNQAVGVQENFEKLPPETRAIALPDASVVSYFLDVFGRPKRTTTCECERGQGSDLNQVLHLVNSDKLQKKLSDPKGRLTRLLEAKKSDPEIVEELYLASLSRLPTQQEQATVRRLLQAASSRREGLEDLLWTLVNCSEFVFNH